MSKSNGNATGLVAIAILVLFAISTFNNDGVDATVAGSEANEPQAVTHEAAAATGTTTGTAGDTVTVEIDD